MKVMQPFPCLAILIIILSTMISLSACTQVHDTKSSIGNIARTKSTDNSSLMNIQPTGDADTELSNTDWITNQSNDIGTINFNKTGNIVHITHYGNILYEKQPETSKIIFDASPFINLSKTITLDRYIEEQKRLTKTSITTRKKKLADPKLTGDEKAKQDEALKTEENYLQKLERLTPETTAELTTIVNNLKSLALALESHKAFEGTITGNELTIEKFPVCNAAGNGIVISKVVFKKV
ncbi:MAG: hypothetical protein ACTTH7_00180 [Treponema sp.]